MKEYAHVTCAILTPEDLSPPPRAECVFGLFERHAGVRPTIAGNVEPLRYHWQNDGGDKTCWRDPLLWKNTGTKIAGSLWFGRGKKHSCIYAGSELGNAKVTQGEWIAFLTDACVTCDADLGYLHLTTQREMEDASIPYSSAYSIDRGLTSREIGLGIPNLCWAMVFGKAYQDFFGRAHQCSAAVVRAISPCQIYVQTTSSIEDVASDYASFLARRNLIKNEIGEIFLTKAGAWKPVFEFRK